ncbi:hypothetical protein [Streptomyces anulatus]|uniref:hypothetical protein n=1 Tax=Streptomyces anulatus TaxID=1892 RepID=UPI00365D82C5
MFSTRPSTTPGTGPAFRTPPCTCRLARDFVRLRAVEEARRTGVAAYIDTWGNA